MIIVDRVEEIANEYIRKRQRGRQDFASRPTVGRPVDPFREQQRAAYRYDDGLAGLYEYAARAAEPVSRLRRMGEMFERQWRDPSLIERPVRGGLELVSDPTNPFSAESPLSALDIRERRRRADVIARRAAEGYTTEYDLGRVGELTVQQVPGRIARTLRGPEIPEGVRDPAVGLLAEGLEHLPGAGPLVQAGEAMTGRDLSRIAADIVVPRYVIEVAAEFVPGIGYGPDALRVARRLWDELPEAARVSKATVRRWMASPQGQRAIRIVQSERGALELGGEGAEQAGRAAGMSSAARPAGEPPEARPPRPVEAQAAEAGGAGAGEPPLPPTGPVGPEDRGRVAKQIAGGIERQGPEFVQQEAIRSQQRSQRAAIVRQIRRDTSLTSEERKTAIRRALAGEYHRGEYAPLEISDFDFGVAERMIRDSDLREFEYVGALVALSRLRSGQHVREFEQKLLGQVFGPEVLKAVQRREKSMASRIAEMWGVSAEDVARAAREEELTRGTGRLRESALDTIEQVSMRRLARQTGEAREKATRTYLRKLAKQEARDLRELNQEIARSTRQMVREYDRYLRTTPEGLAERAVSDVKTHLENLRRFKNPTAAQKAEIARLGRLVDDGTVETVGEIVRYWSQGNRTLLDVAGETEGMKRMTRIIQNAFTGEVTDSWVAQLAFRNTLLEGALIHNGLEPQDAARISKLMMESEVTRRYGNNVPESVQRSLDMLKGLQRDSATGTILEGLAVVSEEFKNLMFGIDLGVFGIQMRASVQGGLIPGIAGAINRALTAMHHPLFGELYLQTTLDRRTANMLDGLLYGRRMGGSQGPEAVTGVAGKGLVMSIPGYGRVAENLTDFQFGTILGGVRDTLYEGNLLLLHLLRQDITNPRVRAKAADWANLLSGFGRRAQTAKRQTLERASFISPAMTRAQFGEIIALGKLLSPTAKPEERILAALSITSYAASWLAIGKLLNDRFGIGDFGFDPTQPGAGTITLATGGQITIPFMANASLKRTIMQSFRALAEEDPDAIKTAWLRYASGRQATAGRAITGLLTGHGFTSEGRFKTDITRRELLTSLAPLPPVAQQVIHEGVNPLALSLEALGIGNYPRSDFDRADELIGEHGGDHRAAFFVAEGSVRDIVKRRWQEALEPKLKEIGAYVVKGEPGRRQRIEFEEWDAIEADAAARLQGMIAERSRPPGTYRTIAELRTAVVDHNLEAYMQLHGVSATEAAAQIRRTFNAMEPVKNFTKNEALWRLERWRENPELLEEAAMVDWEQLSEEERAIIDALPR